MMKIRFKYDHYFDEFIQILKKKIIQKIELKKDWPLIGLQTIASLNSSKWFRNWIKVTGHAVTTRSIQVRFLSNFHQKFVAFSGVASPTI